MPGLAPVIAIRIDKRRARVAELRKAGKTKSQIAEELHCNESTIARDLRALNQAWQIAKVDTEAERTLMHERLEALLSAVWPQAVAGHLKAVDEALRVLKQEAELLGLDAPTKREISGPDGDPIEVATTVALSVEERDARIADVVRLAVERNRQQAALPEPQSPAELLEQLRQQQNGWHSERDN